MSICQTCNGRGQIQAGYAGEELQNCPDCTVCKYCHGTCKTLLDDSLELPCSVCCAPEFLRCTAIGAEWLKNSSLEKWFPFTAEHIRELEKLVALLVWLKARKYRHLVHRHTDTFRAIDESMNVYWESDQIADLPGIIANNLPIEKAP